MGEPYEGPDIRVLWNKTPKAARQHLCDACNDAIEPGEKYESRGYVEDGVFKAEKVHLWAYWYPSGCPSKRARDIAEMSAFDAKDKAALTFTASLSDASPKPSSDEQET